MRAKQVLASAYYNEIDPKAAAWLRELIARGLIAPGIVDERDIRDVTPGDIRGFTQCHFFAGIGTWSYALRQAGWPDARPVWTASCPCQPFSSAGRGDGFADERHLWPALLHLIRECRPEHLYGEQVANGDGLAWLDLVQADLEGEGYASGAIDLCAAGVGAPHIRQRLWLVAHPKGRGCGIIGDEMGQGDSRYPLGGGLALGVADPGGPGLEGRQRSHQGEGVPAPGQSGFGGMAHTGSHRARKYSRKLFSHEGQHAFWPEASDHPSEHRGATGGMANADGGHASAERKQCGGQHGLLEENGRASALAHAAGEQREPGGLGATGEPSGSVIGFARCGDASGPADEQGRAAEPGGVGGPGPVNGFWRDADWLFCRDGKWRPARSGSSVLAHGAPARMASLRGFGNGIVSTAATEIIRATM